MKLRTFLSAIPFFGLLAISAHAQQSAPLYKDPKAPVEKRVEDLLGKMTASEKITMIAGTGYMDLAGNERLGIPAFKLTDGPMGTRCYGPSTAYANGLALACTWDRELSGEVGVALGRDARARDVNILLGPGMNLYRSPMNGRNFEYLGEDPILAGDMASDYINGVQSQGVGVTAKHFAGNEQEFKRHELSTNVDERTLRELYLKPFQIVVKNGALGIMSSYNPLNGIHASQNDWLLNKVLKGEWGFQGLVMSDWGSCYDTKEMANGGLDLEMPSGMYYNENMLQPLIDAGIVTQATIDDKVRRILRVAFTLGWFDRPQLDLTISRDDSKSDAVALRGARECVTLLKNKNNLLPLDLAKTKKIVLLGHNADPAADEGSGSAYTNPFHAESVYEGIKKMAGDGAQIVLVPWAKPGVYLAKDAYGANGTPPIPKEYVDAVKTADVVIVCEGFFPTTTQRQEPILDYEGEGLDRSYELPPGQDEVIKTALALNPKTVVILNAGGSVATEGWVEHAPVLLDALYPGQDGGTAIAEILFGKTNPSGKLAFSWEKRWQDSAAYGNYPTKETPTSNTYKEGVFLGYRWFDSKKIEPLFPFGYGLSYTTFEYSDLKLSEPDSEGNITATATIKNTGKVAGAEIAQLYVQPPAANVPRPVRELKGFTRLELQPGESKTATITFSRDDLAYWDPTAKKWTVTPGGYVVAVGGSSRQLPLHADLKF
jgi:beta-glucosidase